MITYEFAPGERIGSWAEDGAGAESNGTGVWEGLANLVLVTTGKGDRSLIHPPDRSPLPSMARRRKAWRWPLACSPCPLLHTDFTPWPRERSAPQEAFLNLQCYLIPPPYGGSREGEGGPLWKLTSPPGWLGLQSSVSAGVSGGWGLCGRRQGLRSSPDELTCRGVLEASSP